MIRVITCKMCGAKLTATGSVDDVVSAAGWTAITEGKRAYYTCPKCTPGKKAEKSKRDE
jgi:hypothetical protein